ncbi:MAG: hypothetical protein J7623_05140 [Chitinophaga sp.]|uniref:hypothetical protein n=1 Tax=Chitinophaga sp. TaxID=1869181 RepID=UPI001B0B86A0|nr:hypothetical protein [Chitinophaga sp.]MBO9728003.1 hypothetical protein [Chitinophaga sp.]
MPDYFRMDGRISRQNGQYSLALNINNLLNAYLYSGALYDTYYYWQAEPGRISAGIKF